MRKGGSTMTDNDITAVLQSADRTRPASEAERRRMRKALDNAIELDSAIELDGAAPNAELNLPPAEAPPEERRRRGWPALMATAATVVLALGLLGWLRDRPDVEAPTATIVAPTTPADVRALCAAEIATLDAAVEQWGSVADWSASIDGEPDLAQLTADALDGLSAVDPALADDTEQMRGVVSERSTFDLPPGPTLDEHAIVVRQGLRTIVETIGRFDPASICRLDAVKAELTS